MRPLWWSCVIWVGLATPALSQDARTIAESARSQGISVSPGQVQAALRRDSAQRGQTSGTAGQPTPDEQQPEEHAVDVNRPPVTEPELSPLELLMSGRAPFEVSRDLWQYVYRGVTPVNVPDDRLPPGYPGERPAEPPTEKPAKPPVEKPVDTSMVLRQFGYEVFRRPVSTFAPVTNVPVGPDYMVGPGDSFTVTMWGRQNEQLSVTVDRDGKIALPEVGVVSVSGMAFSRMQEYLDNELKRKFTDFKMHVTMGRLRTITVYVIGEALAPGSYTLSSFSTGISALFAAGGPSKNGSLRTIRVQRAGQAPVALDLYDFLLGGDRSRDLRLAEGDTLHIPLIGPVVGVAGHVKRPAIYEMAGPTTLSQALDLAGGANFAGQLRHVQIERVDDHARRIVADFDLSAATDSQQLGTPIQDGDLIKVLSVIGPEQNAISVDGHVLRPAKYELKPGMRLADVLNADLFKPQINMEYGEIERLLPPDLHAVVIPFNLGKALDRDPAQNLELMRFDRIRLFRWHERAKRSVAISGMVYEPNEYPFIPGMRLTEIIDAAGGLQKNSYLKTAELTRQYITQDGMTTEKIDINIEKALAQDPEHNILLQDYDHLVIRPIPELEFDRTMELVGEFRFPGVYPIRRGERLSSAIERAGGFTDRAYLKGAVFTRESAKTLQQRRMDDMIRELEESLLTEAGEAVAMDAEEAQMAKSTLEAKRELVRKLRNVVLDGRVVIRLSPMEEFKAGQYDLELEKGDTLVVPETPGIVTVVGEVFNPMALMHEERGTVGYYLGRVGGPTKEADRSQLAVIRADGSVVSTAQSSIRQIAWDREGHRWSFGGNLMAMPLDAGDTIVVPRKLDRVPWMKSTKDITQILFQIAVAAGVVLAI